MRLASLLLLSLSAAGCALDPVLFKTREERRNLDCYRLAQADAAARFPGQVPPQPARQIAGENTDVLTCSTRYLRVDERPARDEAILSTLSAQVAGLAETAAALVAPGARWHVDAFYPSLPVAQKIAVAARTSLAERGLEVSDRVPTLTAGDVAVLATLPQSEVYRVACARSFSTSVMGPDDVFLGLMIVDPRETALHAGLCQRGAWRWLP
ncbi:MAG: hypothetical protein IAE78_14380 [Myxococcus sp.]|nr:hypothetical protein [Myxococcus sp.]